MFKQNVNQDPGKPGRETNYDRLAVKMFRCALLQQNLQAREWVQHTYRETVLDWLHCHPHTEEACRCNSEEYYVSQTFERFWLADKRTLELDTLVSVLHYLRAILNSVLVDGLRASRPFKELSDSKLTGPGTAAWDDFEDGAKLWEAMQAMFPGERERRLAYLLYHCGISPREIVCDYPHEFHDVQEIACLRYQILNRLLHHPDSMRGSPTPLDAKNKHTRI